MVKACIIGVSGYGQVHYDLLTAAHASRDVEIVGATVINQMEEQEKCALLRGLGCCIFDDYRVMLNELAGKTELCCIPTGIPLHKSMTIAALEAGMHVFVEKPAAGCLADVRAMQAAARKVGRIVAVGYQHLHAPMAMATKQAILAGRIGKLQSIKCLVMWPRDHAYYQRNGWAGRLMVDGVAVNDSPYNNAVAHDLQMSLFLAGASERISAMPTKVEGQLYRANDIESADTASIYVETEEGVPIRFFATHACRELLNPEIHIKGSLGSIVKTHGDSILTDQDGESHSLKASGAIEMRTAMMSAVLDVVRGGSSFYCDLEMASRQAIVVDAVHANGEIRDITSETETSPAGTTRTYIPGIEAAMRAAFDDERALTLGESKAFGMNKK